MTPRHGKRSEETRLRLNALSRFGCGYLSPEARRAIELQNLKAKAAARKQKRAGLIAKGV
jgi:hypothetical protein